MTSIKEAFPIPTLYVNKYLWAQMCSIDTSLPTTYDNIVPFFPLADSRAGDAGWGSKPYVVYDVLFKMRGKAFYPVKKAQIMYFVRGSAEDVIAWSNAISVILDREDSAAKDINNHFSDLSTNTGVFFHRLRVLQIDMVNDNRQDLTVRQQYTGSMVVEMEYHMTNQGSFN